MKKNYSKLMAFFLMVLFSCEKEDQIRVVSCTQAGDYAYLDNYTHGSICPDSLCTMYQDIWKQLFLENNNLTDSYFNNHVELVQSGIQNWNDGITFSICYKIKIGWAIAYTCDQFIIKIKKGNTNYPSLILPRDTYLTKEHIKTATTNRAFSSHIKKISGSNLLKYSSMKDALNALTQEAKVNTFCSHEIFINRVTGNLTLSARADLNYSENKCIKGEVDLISGEILVSDTNCYFTN